jgi:hypothetical protein
MVVDLGWFTGDSEIRHDPWVAVGGVLLGASIPFTLIVVFPNKQLARWVSTDKRPCIDWSRENLSAGNNSSRVERQGWRPAPLNYNQYSPSSMANPRDALSELSVFGVKVVVVTMLTLNRRSCMSDPSRTRFFWATAALV